MKDKKKLKKYYMIRADSRDVLITALAKEITLESVQEAKVYVLLRISCEEKGCGEQYSYEWFSDIPEKSLKCKCGRWVVYYVDEKEKTK